MKKSMTHFVLELILSAGVIMLVSYWFEGVYVKDFSVAFLVAIVLSLLNTFVKPVLSFVALPITFMSLGLFQFVVNGFVLHCATILLTPDFQIFGFAKTILISIVISLLYSLLGIGKNG